MMENFLLTLIAWAMPAKNLDRMFSRPSLPPALSIKLLSRMKPSLFDRISRKKTMALFKRASKSVPAYRTFLQSHGVDSEKVRSFEDFERLVPQTTKDNYVRQYAMAERCLDGKLPKMGYLDESAGSTGLATEWVRSIEEEIPYAAQMKQIFPYLFGHEKSKQTILLNGLVMNVWAGGRRFMSAAAPFGIVKNTGPDPLKIVECIKDHGPGCRYIIGGYPPLLKEVVDTGKETEGFDWKEYDVHLFTGGEGFVEGWRNHMESQLKEGAKIFSMYGALDLELGIAVETPLSVALKKRLSQDVELRKELLGTRRSPCFLGQYSPINFHIKQVENSEGIQELEVTLLNLDSASPKIKYNIGDEGGVIPFDRMSRIIEEKDPGVISLPFLYIFGRSDGAVTTDGALIFPSEISEALLSDEEVVSKVNTFVLSIETDETWINRVVVNLEAKKGVAVSASLEELCSNLLVASLAASNPCFAKSYKKNPEKARPKVRIFPFQSGIFAEKEGSFKRRYIKNQG